MTTQNTSGISVQSGTGFRTKSGDPTPVPIVRATATDKNGQTVTVDMLPIFARRIGLDLIAAASSATDEVSVRAWARQHGQDADGIIAWMKTGTQELLDSEGEP
jgi:hypothetical protein